MNQHSAEMRGAGVFLVDMERIEVTGHACEGGQISLGDGAAPGDPLAAEGQVFEIEKFQVVLRCASVCLADRLGLCEYSRHALESLRAAPRL